LQINVQQAIIDRGFAKWLLSGWVSTKKDIIAKPKSVLTKWKAERSNTMRLVLGEHDCMSVARSVKMDWLY